MNTEVKLGYVILYVESVVRTVEFYEQAFGLARGFVHESGEYAQMETGATALAFAGEKSTPTAAVIAPSRSAGKAPAVEVALTVENVEGAYARALRAGAVAVLAPAPKPWGQVVSYVRDCNGFLVEICSPLGV